MKKKHTPVLPAQLAAVKDSLYGLVEAIADTMTAFGQTPAPVAPRIKRVMMPKVITTQRKVRENARLRPLRQIGLGMFRGNMNYHNAQKTVWSLYSKEQREARIRKMLAGRGLRRKKGV